MIHLGIALLAIGMGDLVAGGLGGEIRGVGEAVRATLTSLVTGAILFIATGGRGWCTATALLGAILVASTGWSVFRHWPRTKGRPWLALGALVVPLGLLAAASGSLQAPISPVASQWLAGLPFPAVAEVGLDRFVLIAGIAVALTATANGVVRVVLSAAGTRIDRPESRLRGGRLIGALERLMIFGLALAGEPTAAALVVSAKSLLRFPEVSRVAQSTPASPQTKGAPGAPAGEPLEIDSLTEYFLVGSLTSWVLALAPVVLLRRG